MLKHGLGDVYNNCSMGVCAESCAQNHAITREDQVKSQTANLMPIISN
ncbi:Acetyl-CoA acetyltransferase cytosolic 1 [Bienertia sinuspersici]